ncbi:TLC domain-containing protein [Astrocystis sublimbata]|nr:TLC domain-containing protein [Astrocystis sublimbata]
MAETSMSRSPSRSPSPPPETTAADVARTTSPRLHLDLDAHAVPRELQVERLRTPTTPNTRRSSAQSQKSMNGPLYMQTSNNKVLIRRVKKKGNGTMKSLTRWLLDNQIGLSFNLIALIFLTHMFIPKARPHTLKFFTLSYRNSETGEYAVGGGDYYFISFCIVLFTGLRAGLMEHVFAPMAKHWGLDKRKDMTRFSEQAWLLTYYAFFWPLGVYIYYNSPSFLNLDELWTNWPNREVIGLVKAYFLAQWAFWLQQVLVIHIEERRKDHWQMLTHHFLTITLMTSSYYYHHTRVGTLILVLMDIVDIFLPLAKCLKYLGFSTLCDVMFGMFMVSWFVARHIFYNLVCWNLYKDAMNIMPHGCFHGTKANLQGPTPIPDGWRHWVEPFRNPQGTVCWSQSVMNGFLYTLLGLQVITIFWFFLIVRVAVRVLRGGSADDPRSDDEAESDELEYEYEEAQPLEEEVGVESIDLKSWERRTGVKRAASSSAVSLPGHSDRKELLGRIGCEKQVD